MNKIQYKIGLIFLVLIIFIIVSLSYMYKTTHTNAKILTQETILKQTALLSATVKAFSQSLGQHCYDYTYWDEMVNFVKKPNQRWARLNINEPVTSFGFSFAWVFDKDFNQIYGFQILEDESLSKAFISTKELKKKFTESWFSDFWIEREGKAYQIYVAPIQPSEDIGRKTEPNGWYLVGRIYEGKIIEEISDITNSSIEVVLPEEINEHSKSLSEHDADIFASFPLKDKDQKIIIYLTSFHNDKAITKYITSAESTIPIVVTFSLLFVSAIFILLLFYVVKPITVLSNSLSSEDETMLVPLLGKKNEFGALSRMMEHFFIQKKHLETEIQIRTETEIELKEIQVNLEYLVEARTAELVNANNQMQVERDQAKLYLEMAGAIICLLDENANIVLINRMGYNVLGFEEGELIGKNWMDFYYDENTANACNNRFSKLMDGNDTDITQSDYVFNVQTKNREERKLLINSRLTKNPFNGKKAILFSGVDITELKKTEKSLIDAIDKAETANKAQAAFFANMSHELRTPLFGILGYSELMATGDYNEEIKHMSSTINKGGKRLIETLNKVLSLSKLKAEKFEIKLSDTSITKLISETVNLFQVDAASKGLMLSFSKPDEEITTHTDSSVIRDIVNNLIHNAVKFTFYGSINVILESHKDFYTIKVKDTGIGIPQDSLNVIFEEFRQVSEGYSRSFEGTGLGLSITKKYVDLLQGKIELTSVVNQGSEFMISLPLKQKEIQYAD